MKTLEAISHGLHREDLSENFSMAVWDADSKAMANSLLHSITTFEFIVVFLIIYQYLSHLAGITIKLQNRAIDILEAYQEIENIKCFYKEIRMTVERDFYKVYEQAVRMAAAVNVEPSKPRTCTRQKNRSNATPVNDSIHDWYKVNVAIPFLDHIITELESQFSSIAQTASHLLGLVPSVMCTKNLDMSAAVKLYQSNLPSPELFDQEFLRWHGVYSHKHSQERPDTCASALKECDKNLFPNISTLLQIACTLPVTSAECERNASVLRTLCVLE